MVSVLMKVKGLMGFFHYNKNHKIIGAALVYVKPQNIKLIKIIMICKINTHFLFFFFTKIM